MKDVDFTEQIDLIAQDCVAVRLRLLNRFVSGLYDKRLRPLGLKVSQLNILVATAKMGVARPAKMCEMLCLDESTLSRNVERMRDKGWIEVVPDAQDARAQPFRLSKAGRKVLERAIPAWQAAQQEAAELFGGQGLETLRRAARAARRG